MKKDVSPDDLITKAEMFEYVHSCQLPITESQLKELRDLHLMSIHSDENGRGRGHGKDFFWTRQQAELLRKLCLIRTWPGGRNVALRYNLLIWLWLTQEKSSGITLQQVQQAMVHWAQAEQKQSAKQAKKSAQEIVAIVANDNGTRKAIMKLSKILHTYLDQQRGPKEKRLTPEEFIEQIENALYHAINLDKPTNATLHPTGMVKEIGVILWNYEQVLQALQHLTAFSDTTWFRARHIYLSEASLDEEVPRFPLESACMDLSLALQESFLSEETKEGQAWKRYIDRTQVRSSPEGYLIERAFYRELRR